MKLNILPIIWLASILSLTLTSTYAAEERSVITVTGIGSLSLAPDQAIINVAIESRQFNLNKARETANQTMQKALEVIDQLQIERKYVNSSMSRITPEYSYNKGKRTFINYYVLRQLSIDLRDLEKIGLLLETLLDVGINKVSAPRFASTNMNQLKRDALAIATREAKLNAQVIANSLGVNLGKIKRISYNSGNHNPPPRDRALLMSAAPIQKAAETYEIGEIITLSAQVEASFFIE